MENNPKVFISYTHKNQAYEDKVLELAKSDAVILGHHGLNVLGTFSDTPVPCEGINLTP